MKKQNTKRSKKIRNLVLVCALCAVVLTVSTYAWFIGMKTVNVSSFDVKIATTEGLFLSMDGSNWSYQLDAKGAAAYEGNTNTWAEDGLIPVSSVGDMDKTSSRMKLFEKASLTTTKGGYRLLSTRVNNYTVAGDSFTQGKGYVAFDLFIKNLSGTQYYADNEPLNEEAIYLTTNSAVKVSTNGGVAGTGIENSVRVAFAQVGRVKGTTADGDASITGLTCSDVGEGETRTATGICRDAQIWEPNDTKHVENAISWYDTSCKPRTGSDLTLAASYVLVDNTETDDIDESKCSEVKNNTSYPTYTISREIKIEDKVDVYDGLKYNTYETNTIDYATYAAASDKTSYKLVDYPYFTDTMKMVAGKERPTFMTLAPNSITKVRVYVYIEGQDIDNYDFASLGAQISINFGFTKERYTETDTSYTGQSTAITPVEYTATGTVSAISVTGVEYDATNHYFTMNSTTKTTSFTFTDGSANKKAEINGDGNWVITDAE